MDKVSLKASARTKDVTPGSIRRSGFVPGVIYGNIENTQVQCDERDLKRAYVKAGESTLVELDVEGKTVPVLFHALDFHPVSSRMTHVDFYAVDMKKEVEADVHIRFEGESFAVKEHGAIIVEALDTVTVRALPANLPHDLPADLSKLTEIGSTLTVADLSVPEGVTIITDPETVLAVAQEQRQEEAAETVAAAPAEGAAADGTATPAAEGAAPAADAKKEEK